MHPRYLLHLHRHTNPTLIRIKTVGSSRCYAYAYQNETRIIHEEESRWNESLYSRDRTGRGKARHPHHYLVRICRGLRGTSSNCTRCNPVESAIVVGNNEPVRGRALMWENAFLDVYPNAPD